MKKRMSIFAVTIVAAAAIVVSINSFKFGPPVFDTNVEALTDPEIITGNLCMVAPNYACSSQGEVYLDHYPA